MVTSIDTNENSLTLEGIIYPPACEFAGNRSVGHLCEEFTVSELESQLNNIRGLPIAIEHDASELIGSNYRIDTARV